MECIFTAQSGFPFTLQVGANRSGTGDTLNPDLPNLNPGFNGPVILGTQTQWFNPAAFLLPTAGTFGNVEIGSLIGPRLFLFDTSMIKKFRINERWSLQFRAEAFNILNHTNFGEPNPIVFSGTNISPSARNYDHGDALATTSVRTQADLLIAGMICSNWSQQLGILLNFETTPVVRPRDVKKFSRTAGSWAVLIMQTAEQREL